MQLVFLYIFYSSLFPFVFLYGLFSKKLRGSILERLLFGKWIDCFRELKEKEVLWFHAASLGELSGIEAIVKLFSKDSYNILLTTTSGTAQAKALGLKQQGLVSSVAYLPFDHPYLMKCLVNKLNLKLCVIAETELWPSMISVLSKKNIPLFLVNARISDFTINKYKLISFIIREMLRKFEIIFAQSEIDRERFLLLGARPDSIKVIASSKYDFDLEKFKLNFSDISKRDFFLSEDSQVLVAGSVREGEEELIISSFVELKKKIENLALIITPRHPERFNEVFSILKSHGLEVTRWSEGGPKVETNVILLDTIGKLQQAYYISDVSFVGGSLVNIGGHNPLEPAFFAKPIIFGKYMQNSKIIADELIACGGALEVYGENLSEILLRLFLERECRESIGNQAYIYASQYVGVSKQVKEEIQKAL